MKLNRRGYFWWTHGAQGSVEQPPYAIRDHGRWYRVHKGHRPQKHCPLCGGVCCLDSMAILQFGVPRLVSYLVRTRKRFRDLPYWPHEKTDQAELDRLARRRGHPEA